MALCHRTLGHVLRASRVSSPLKMSAVPRDPNDRITRRPVHSAYNGIRYNASRGTLDPFSHPLHRSRFRIQSKAPRVVIVFMRPQAVTTVSSRQSKHSQLIRAAL